MIRDRIEPGAPNSVDSSDRASRTPPRAPASSSPLILRPASYVERLPLSEIFARPQPLEVELGCGDGSFLVQYAQAHPNRNFLGVERLLGRLRKVERKGRREGLSNLKLLRLEISYLVEFMLPLGSVQAFHIYFPDPWPKRRHQARRLLTSKFLDTALAALAPGGTVHLRTDSPDYFGHMLELFGANGSFKAVETPPALADTLTDFERDFQARGVPTLRAGYERAA